MCATFHDYRPIDKPTGAEEINDYPIRKAKLRFTYLYKNIKFSKNCYAWTSILGIKLQVYNSF